MAHTAIYGDAFTAETASDYLVMNNSFITKAFGLATSNLGFTVNDATPHDDTYVEAYGGYTGYAIDTARVQDGDRVSLFVYKDAYWSDILPLFDKTSYAASVNEAFTVSVSGYSIMYYGCATQETIDKNTKPLEGVCVESTQDFKTFTEAGTLDADGKLSVTMDEAGTYYFVVRGAFDDPSLDEVPLAASICKVTVQDKEPEPEPEPEPDTSNAKYFPIWACPIIRYADHTLTLGLSVKFRNLKKTAPDKTETYTFSISLRFFAQLFNK